MEATLETPPVENLSFDNDPRPDIIRDKTQQLNQRQDIIRAIDAERGYDAYVRNTLTMQGYINGLKDSLQMAPPPAPPAVHETEDKS